MSEKAILEGWILLWNYGSEKYRAWVIKHLFDTDKKMLNALLKAIKVETAMELCGALAK